MRRYIFINGYNNDDIKDTSEDEESYEDNDNENLNYNEPLSTSDKLEFLNKHMQSFSDYPLMKSSDDDDEDDEKDEEYEKAFSRKYKHWRKLPRLFDADSARRDNVISNDDLDYENDDVDRENSMEIEKLNTEAPPEMSAIYTEGGVMRPSKHETMPGATGESVI